MRIKRFTLALGLALGASFLVPAAYAAEPALSASEGSSPTQVAKLPVAPDKAPEAAPASGSAGSQPATTAPKSEGKQLAQLTYPVPTTASAAELLQAADDYAFYTDYDHYRQYLQQVISAYPGTKEAGRALALLADDFARVGDQAAADTLFAHLAEADAGTQAFAALVHTARSAHRAKQFAQEEQAYLAYLAAWKGSAASGWVRLRLGDLYRHSLADYDRAIAVFKGLVTEYQTGPLAEEALVSIAESLNWSESDRNEEARNYYEQALTVAQTPGIQVRAFYGLGDMLMVEGELSAASDTFSQIIAAYPTHPSAALAYAMRSNVAEKRGDWDLTVSDVKAFLTYPSSSQFHTARAHWILAQDAFRNGQLDAAEAEFTLLAQIAETSRHNIEFKGEAQAGLAYCYQARGDLRGAMQLFQAAGDVEYYPEKKAVYLFQAAELAKQLGDDGARNRIIARMVAEVPGDHLTVQLVGHEILPAPEI